MKIIIPILVCLMLFSCNNTEDKKTKMSASSSEDTTTKTSVSSSKTSEEKNSSLPQNGDYTTLFESSHRGCNFIDAEIIAKAIAVPSNSITKEANICAFKLTDANGQKTRFNFLIETWDRKKILKEIAQVKENEENFGKDSKLTQYRISETGDTYLSMHQNRMVRILNEVNNSIIVLFYQPDIDPAESDRDLINQRKDEARERAYSITNYLLKTYQK